MILQQIENIDKEKLLTDPSDTAMANPQIQRCEVTYKNLSNKYNLSKESDVSHQYCTMYSARLGKMRPLLETKAKSKWTDTELRKPHEISDENVDACAIVGTIFKQQSLKPSILRDMCDDSNLLPQPVLTKYVSADDYCILEDELQRITLVGNIDKANLVTGVVCCVKGHKTDDGKFEVEETIYPGLPDPVADIIVESDSFILFVSGLELHNNTNLLALDLLVDYLVGQMGQDQEQDGVSHIARVIMAGNYVTNTKKALNPLSKNHLINDASKAKALRDLDNILCQIACVSPVDVMPGECDPANCSLPQQPLHKCLLPKSSQYSTLTNVTNPYECCIGGRVVVGCSGQNVKDIMSCSDLDPLQCLESMCDWGHLAPTAPDTLTSYPFINLEPFIMDSAPDIFFASNQGKFSSKILSGDRPRLLITVPRFSIDGVSVLVNLKNLDCQLLQFGGDAKN